MPFKFSNRRIGGKERFQSSKKRKRAGANRCPEFDSENLSHHPSVASVPTFRKVSALCASPFGGAAQQDQHLRADEYPQGAGRICNAPSSRTAALGIGPYTVRWKLAGTGGQGRPPLQSVPHRQRREIFCQKKARGRRRIGYTSSPQQRTPSNR